MEEMDGLKHYIDALNEFVKQARQDHEIEPFDAAQMDKVLAVIAKHADDADTMRMIVEDVMNGMLEMTTEMRRQRDASGKGNQESFWQGWQEAKAYFTDLLRWKRKKEEEANEGNEGDDDTEIPF